ASLDFRKFTLYENGNLGLRTSYRTDRNSILFFDEKEELECLKPSR
ncbi:MAG: hypothetical protein RIQ98_1163, partial [Bacteroidota bacterium]